MAINNDNQEQKSALAKKEEEIQNFWKRNKIFEKSLQKPAPKGDFIFYEGPPTANNKPGIHHLEARAFKDLIPRYKTMRGYRVSRKAGWDTHGLPVELEVEKKLGLKSKKEIEKFGIDKFNEECKKSIWKYINEWRDFTERMGYWIDLDHPYITYTHDFIESVWKIVKRIHERGLLYKDYKVLPWCPRCGTALSSHELAQGYEDVKDLSVYIKFKVVGEKNTYLLAWTTTPWTLPGNVALAVGKDIEYVKVSNGNELLWFGKDARGVFYDKKQIIENRKGKDLVDLEYEPLFPYLSENLKANSSQLETLDRAYKVYPADFVTTEDGTGIVHTAVMYGQDDFELGTKVGLPKHHLVGEDGKFLAGMGELSGKFVKDKETENQIISDLASRNLLYKKEHHLHSYPFCWRCKTPLIYFARDSWYIKMSAIRDKLVAENQKIHWEPEYIRDGRFGEWLSEVKDWAVSRERYWGTPLPVWLSEDGSEMEVIGSIEELKSKIPKRNKFYLMRHGESEHNITKTLSSDPNNPHHLTKNGKETVMKAAQKLESPKIDYIFASDFIRTKETADIVANVIGIDKEKIIYDKRLREMNFGDLNNNPTSDSWKIFENNEQRYSNKYPGGENFLNIRKRVGEFIYEIDKKYQGKNILIISHEITLWLLFAIINNWTKEGSLKERIGDKEFVENASIKSQEFTALPHDEDYYPDLHRPHIDSIEFVSNSGKRMKRIPEVMDAWFDSGSMPFGQYPDLPDFPYPADYISEGLDQTRGWFYTLHAIGNLMEGGLAFRNVICLGLVLDKDGQKMSKSKGNVVDPILSVNRFGADALRYWMYSVNQLGESKNFDEKSVDEVVKKVFNLLLNCVKFYELYADREAEVTEGKNVLDRWILSYLNKVTEDVTTSLDSYKIFEASRAIRDFIADLSQWYLRRSRDRFKDDDDNRATASATLRKVLLRLARLMAPFTPFTAEDIHLRLNGGGESVHLCDWPEAGEINEEILEGMSDARETASAALEARAREGIKVRQPLARLTIKKDLGKDFLSIIKDEVNVKEILVDPSLNEEISLDARITDELKDEGNLREIIRSFQEVRKEKGLTPQTIVRSTVTVGEATAQIIEKNLDEIKKRAHLSKVVIDKKSNAENNFLKIDLE